MACEWMGWRHRWRLLGAGASSGFTMLGAAFGPCYVCWPSFSSHCPSRRARARCLRRAYARSAAGPRSLLLRFLTHAAADDVHTIQCMPTRVQAEACTHSVARKHERHQPGSACLFEHALWNRIRSATATQSPAVRVFSAGNSKAALPSARVSVLDLARHFSAHLFIACLAS